MRARETKDIRASACTGPAGRAGAAKISLTLAPRQAAATPSSPQQPTGLETQANLAEVVGGKFRVRAGDQPFPTARPLFSRALFY